MEIKYITIDPNSYRAFKKADKDAVEIIGRVPNGGAIFTYDGHFKHITALIVISSVDDLRV